MIPTHFAPRLIPKDTLKDLRARVETRGRCREYCIVNSRHTPTPVRSVSSTGNLDPMRRTYPLHLQSWGLGEWNGWSRLRHAIKWRCEFTYFRASSRSRILFSPAALSVLFLSAISMEASRRAGGSGSGEKRPGAMGWRGRWPLFRLGVKILAEDLCWGVFP